MRIIQASTLAFALTLPLVGPATAMSAEDFVHVSLLTGWRAQDGVHMAGILIEMEPGWHTYWRRPGEAGIPPEIDWSGSRGMSQARIVWPVPELFDQNGIRTVGYTSDVILPLEIRTLGNGPVTLDGQMFLGVCSDVCIPVDIHLSGTLPADGAPHAGITASLENQPLDAADLGRAPAACRARPIDDGLRLELSLDPGPGTQAPVDHLVVETADPSVWISEPAISRNGHDLNAVVDLVPADAKPFLLSRADVRVTLFQGGRVIEFSGCEAM